VNANLDTKMRFAAAVTAAKAVMNDGSNATATVEAASRAAERFGATVSQVGTPGHHRLRIELDGATADLDIGTDAGDDAEHDIEAGIEADSDTEFDVDAALEALDDDDYDERWER
jgi:hypothetical protein